MSDLALKGRIFNGDNTVDVKCVIVGNGGITDYQDYIGLNTVQSDDLWFHFTVNGSHMIFE